MVQYMRAHLDASFAALSDATRRGVLEQLGRSDASITDLAEKFHMTLTGMKKHVGVLEQSGLVTTEKLGRVRTCKLGPRRLEEETAWLQSETTPTGHHVRRRARRRADMQARPAPMGGRDGMAREIPPAPGRTLRRVGQGCRGIETEGEGR